MEFVAIAALAVLGFWLYQKRSNHASSRPQRLDLEGSEWLRTQGIAPSSVKCSAYKQPWETSTPGAVVVVGVGKDAKGTARGFVYERRADGSIEGHILAAPAIAMRDRSAAAAAKMGGQPIMSTLVSQSLQWTAEGKPYTVL